MNRRALSFMAIFITLGVSLLYVRSRFLLVELSYAISQSQQQKTKLEQEKRSLMLELATLRSPRRIERLATKELGLSRSQTPIAVIRIEEASGHEAQ